MFREMPSISLKLIFGKPYYQIYGDHTNMYMTEQVNRCKWIEVIMMN